MLSPGVFVVLVSFAVLSGRLSEHGLSGWGSFVLHLRSILFVGFALVVRKPLIIYLHYTICGINVRRQGVYKTSKNICGICCGKVFFGGAKGIRTTSPVDVISSQPSTHVVTATY